MARSGNFFDPRAPSSRRAEHAHPSTVRTEKGVRAPAAVLLFQHSPASGCAVRSSGMCESVPTAVSCISSAPSTPQPVAAPCVHQRGMRSAGSRVMHIQRAQHSPAGGCAVRTSNRYARAFSRVAFFPAPPALPSLWLRRAFIRKVWKVAGSRVVHFQRSRHSRPDHGSLVGLTLINVAH